jgi:hypothetical protein
MQGDTKHFEKEVFLFQKWIEYILAGGLSQLFNLVFNEMGVCIPSLQENAYTIASKINNALGTAANTRMTETIFFNRFCAMASCIQTAQLPLGPLWSCVWAVCVKMKAEERSIVSTNTRSSAKAPTRFLLSFMNMLIHSLQKHLFNTWKVHVFAHNIDCKYRKIRFFANPKQTSAFQKSVGSMSLHDHTADE